MKIVYGLVFSLTIVPIASSAQDQREELRVFSAETQATEQTQEGGLVVKNVVKDVNLTGQKNIDHWEFPYGGDEEQEVWYRLRVEQEGVAELATGEESSTQQQLGALEFGIPFGEGPIEIYFEPTEAENTVSFIRTLFQDTNISDQPLELLFENYQKARTVAMTRVGQLKGEFNKLTVYDVQAVVAFLDHAVVLRDRSFAIPDDAATAASQWLENAYDQNPTRVNSALAQQTETRVEDLVEKIAALEGNNLTALWRKITEGTDECSATKARRLQAYKSVYFDMGRDDRIRISNVTGITKSVIQESINKCITEDVEAAIDSGQYCNAASRANTLAALQVGIESSVEIRGEYAAVEQDTSSIQESLEHLRILESNLQDYEAACS